MPRYIDADALIKNLDDAIQDAKRKNEICDYWEDDRSNLLYYLDNAPTIDAVEVVRGEWLPFEYGDDTWHKCSVCGIADKYKGSMPRPSGTIAEWEYVRNYCPNCGAKMKGADDE